MHLCIIISREFATRLAHVERVTTFPARVRSTNRCHERRRCLLLQQIELVLLDLLNLAENVVQLVSVERGNLPLRLMLLLIVEQLDRVLPSQERVH